MNKEMLCKRILSIMMGTLLAMSMFMIVSIDGKATRKVIWLEREDSGAGELVVSEDCALILREEYGSRVFAFYGSGCCPLYITEGASLKINASSSTHYSVSNTEPVISINNKAYYLFDNSTLYVQKGSIVKYNIETMYYDGEHVVHAFYLTIIPPETSSADLYKQGLKNKANEISEVYRRLISGEVTGEQIVYYNEGGALPYELLQTLQSCPGVTLDFKCEYEGKQYHFRIKGGTGLILDENIPWYGPLYMAEYFGEVQDEPSVTGHGSYVVKSGDTLSQIAAAFNTTVDYLVSLNNLQNRDYIKEGQVLKI